MKQKIKGKKLCHFSSQIRKVNMIRTFKDLHEFMKHQEKEYINDEESDKEKRENYFAAIQNEREEKEWEDSF